MRYFRALGCIALVFMGCRGSDGAGQEAAASSGERVQESSARSSRGKQLFWMSALPFGAGEVQSLVHEGSLYLAATYTRSNGGTINSGELPSFGGVQCPEPTALSYPSYFGDEHGLGKSNFVLAKVNTKGDLEWIRCGQKEGPGSGSVTELIYDQEEQAVVVETTHSRVYYEWLDTVRYSHLESYVAFTPQGEHKWARSASEYDSRKIDTNRMVPRSEAAGQVLYDLMHQCYENGITKCQLWYSNHLEDSSVLFEGPVFPGYQMNIAGKSLVPSSAGRQVLYYGHIAEDGSINWVDGLDHPEQHYKQLYREERLAGENDNLFFMRMPFNDYVIWRGERYDGLPISPGANKTGILNIVLDTRTGAAIAPPVLTTGGEIHKNNEIFAGSPDASWFAYFGENDVNVAGTEVPQRTLMRVDAADESVEGADLGDFELLGIAEATKEYVLLYGRARTEGAAFLGLQANDPEHRQELIVAKVPASLERADRPGN